MKPTRRWFQYSLRSFLVLLTALAVWLSVVVNRVHQQRETVNAIEELGFAVIFDWQLNPLENKRQDIPKWLRRFVGDHPFEVVYAVWATTATSDFDIQRAIPSLQRLPVLREVRISASVSQDTQAKLEASLPNCEIGFFGITHRME